MRIYHTAALALAAAMLAACASQPAPTQSAAAESTVEVSAATAAPDTGNTGDTADANAAAQLRARYIDAAALPAPEAAAAEGCTADDRTLTLEDSPDNALEYMVYQLYYNKTAADFESYMALIGDNENFRVVSENEEKRFDEGKYMQSYTIHRLAALPAAALDTLDAAVLQGAAADAESCGLEQCALVSLDISWRHNAAALAAAPQLGDGRYQRYYLIGQKPGEEYKIYNVYWGETQA